MIKRFTLYLSILILFINILYFYKPKKSNKYYLGKKNKFIEVKDENLKVILNDQEKTIRMLIKRSLKLENDINDIYHKFINLTKKLNYKL